MKTIRIFSKGCFAILLAIWMLTMMAQDATVQAFVPANQGSRLVMQPPLTVPSNRHYASVDEKQSTVNADEGTKSKENIPFYKLPKAAYRIYTTYAKKLWRETDVEHRKRIANDEVRSAIRNMQHVLLEEYAEFPESSQRHARDKLFDACDDMLTSLPNEEEETKSYDEEQKVAEKNESKELAVASKPENKSKMSAVAQPKKKHRSILFGALMGASVACWVFSGNYMFTGLFCLMTILGQLEYYRMVMNTGIYPARRISVIGAASMFLTVSAVDETRQTNFHGTTVGVV